MTFHFPSKWNHLISNILSMHHASNGIRVDELFVSLVVSRKQTKTNALPRYFFFFFFFFFFLSDTSNAYGQMMSFPTSNYLVSPQGLPKSFLLECTAFVSCFLSKNLVY